MKDEGLNLMRVFVQSIHKTCLNIFRNLVIACRSGVFDQEIECKIAFFLCQRFRKIRDNLRWCIDQYSRGRFWFYV